ncbi:MAG: hypothetical protein IH919_07925 [Deltaproteobacteria bacterium]|nr:hypothetical protein [Deltaproteobacteria bacterium]
MTEFTPGPWHYGFSDETDKPGFTVDVYGQDGQPIAAMERTAGNGTYGAERDSNARLIAAAPDLLAALEELMTQLIGIGIAIDGEDSGQWHGTEGLSFDQTRAAIAKARNQEASPHAGSEWE